MILLLAAVILLAVAFQSYTRRRGLKGLDASLSIPKALVEQDASFDLVLELVNHSRAFFPFLKVSIHLPKGLTPEVDEKQLRTDMHGGKYVYLSSWLGPRQRLSFKIPLKASQRGRFLTGDMTVFCGDFLGLSSEGQSFSQFLEAVAMPKAVEVQEIEQIAGGFIGDISVNRFLFEDPVLTVGYRDYTGREPMKMLAWTQIARTGRMTVKQYDYTMETSVMVVLNMECRLRKEETETFVEATYSIARTVCEQLEEKGIQYSFQTNAVTAGDFASWQSVGEGLGGHHLMHILEGLGRGLDQVSSSCDNLLKNAVRSSDSTRGLMFITPENDPEILSLAAEWAERAGVNLWTVTGEEILCRL
ncbi:MAG: DUF58 domain-containing protein [Lachnospiraceae bacterium]|nr:DUF58 domain-containing protein [Lachnospiraceae bacterium]